MGRNDIEFRNKTLEELEHLWKDNPVIKNNGIAWPIGWVLEVESKGIVGFFGNIPVAYELKEKRLIAAVASSWVVDKEYRNYSMLLVGSYFSQRSNADLFLNATANYTAGKVFYEFFKAKKMPHGSYDSVYFQILNYRKFTLSATIKKGLPFGGALTPPLSLLIHSLDKLTGRNFKRCDIKGPGGEERWLPYFDERFDEFWESLRTRYSRFLCVRDSQSLNWHFKYAVLKNKICIFTIENKSRIISYAIFLRQDNPRIGLKRVRLIDFQAIDDNPSLLAKTIVSGLRRCKQEDVHVLEAIGFNPQKMPMIKKFLTHKRRLASWPFFYKTSDESLSKELENPDLWDPCLFDGDASL
jgi:hypothetical protein